jgi:DNA processing protein
VVIKSFRVSSDFITTEIAEDTEKKNATARKSHMGNTILEELEAFVILNHTSGVTVSKAKQLIGRFGSAACALQATPSSIAQALEGDVKTASALIKTFIEQAWKEDLKLASKLQAKILYFGSEDYPACLYTIEDPPLVLYVQGSLLPVDQQGIALVGTRECTIYGREVAEKMGREIALYGKTVISGLARGIDTAAHIGAMQAGRTIAFIGSGLARLYPRENETLAAKICHMGAVISEYSMAKPPDKWHFPRRNRLISAFCKGIILIEAPLKSGAMITMELAHKDRKKCFVIPGRIDAETFRGNHFLIKTQKAQLVENTQEMLSILEPQKKPGSNQPSLPLRSVYLGLSEDEQHLLHLFPAEEIAFEDLASKTALPIAKLGALLIGLVLKQVIREFPGKFYKKVS